MVGLLGRGGSAVVELAVDPSGRRVATKRVPLVGSAAQIRQAQRRLRREAEILRSLAHPGIVPVLEILEEGPDLILVMPAMAENLEERVGRLGPLPEQELIGVGRTLLEALSAAHRQGVVHRDIKPANVLFDAAGRPALADFGAAVTSDMTAGLTTAGTVLGTAMWMAPEQARGEQAGPAGDVFSLAATLVFAASGRGPYEPGPPLVVLGRAARGEVVPPPPRVPPSLRETLTSMLSTDPALRPSAASVLGGVGSTRSEPADPVPAYPTKDLGHPGESALSRRAARRWGAKAAAGWLWHRLLGDPPERRRPIRRSSIVVAGVAVAALIAGLVAVLAGGGAPAVHPRAAGLPSAPIPCKPLPYQPCGASTPAPHTDGINCDPGWYNLDGSRSDGCESHSDYVPGTALTQRSPVRANLVPVSATDTFTTHVSGDALNLCWGSLRVTLTAPPGAAERVEVTKGAATLARAVSVDGTAATAVVSKPSCFGADSEDLTVTVTALASTGAASAGDFTLVRNAGW